MYIGTDAQDAAKEFGSRRAKSLGVPTFRVVFQHLQKRQEGAIANPMPHKDPKIPQVHLCGHF